MYPEQANGSRDRAKDHERNTVFRYTVCPAVAAPEMLVYFVIEGAEDESCKDET